MTLYLVNKNKTREYTTRINKLNMQKEKILVNYDATKT